MPNVMVFDYQGMILGLPAENDNGLRTIVLRSIEIAIVCIVLAVASLPSSAFSAGRVALIYGNGAYENAPKLLNPANDASLVAKSLKAVGFDVVSVNDATQTQMRKSMARFGRLAENADIALFYYAGHGLQVAGRNWLLPIDADIESSTDLPASAINASNVLELMELSGAKARIAILDACRNNPLSRSLSRATSRGLAKIDSSAAGTMIIFATQPGNVALDGSGKNSPFSKALANHITKPGIEIRQMMGRVRKDVMADTNDKQVPWVNEAIVGDIFLASAPDNNTDPVWTKPDANANTSNNSAIEISFWDSVKSTNDAIMIQLYLDRFPDGLFAEIAKLQIAKLKINTANPKIEVAREPKQKFAVLRDNSVEKERKMKETARQFSINLQHSNSASAEDLMGQLTYYYANRVNFFGKVFNLREIEDDKRRFARRWPDRHYEMDMGATDINCYPDSKICTVETIVDWRVASTSRNASSSGRSSTFYEIEFINNEPRIVVEDSKVLSRNQ